MSRSVLWAAAWAAIMMPAAGSGQNAQQRPNIVLMFADNLGVGEVGLYGGTNVRGVATPNINRIADEGIRLDNFNTEPGCIRSRIALMTGRYAARTTSPLPLEEVTIAEGLRDLGYATGLFGKWHLSGGNWEGDGPYREGHDPQYQGFDEWYGIPGTSHVAQFTTFETWDPQTMTEPHVWEGGTGQPSRRVMPYDMESRGRVDREAAERGIAFMERSVGEGRPFFFYYPMTQIHFPTLPHPDFAGATGKGDFGDAMASVDHDVGLVLEAIDRLGIADNTIVLWCTDDGAEGRRPWRGSPGPWRGFYAGPGSGMEGGIRTPCVVRWPGRIPAGRISNEIVHQVDLLPTFAAAVGEPGMVPDDRLIDGVNQLPFLEGREEHSNRESLVIVWGRGIRAIKWRDWKLWYDFPMEMTTNRDAAASERMRLIHLPSDPREETDVKDFNPWVLTVMDSIAAEYEASTRMGAQAPAAPSRVLGAQGEMSGGSPAAAPATEARNPDFSGYWTADVSAGDAPSPGGGWGPRFMIAHHADSLIVMRQIYHSSDIQPPLKFRYALGGAEARNTVRVGRGVQEQFSTARWDGNTLEIVTRHVDPAADRGRGVTSEVRHVLAYQPGDWRAHHAQLVIETTRVGVLGGITSTTRTVYELGAVPPAW